MLQVLVVYYVLMFIFLMLTCYRVNLKKYYIVSKCLCSFGFLFVAILGKVQSLNHALFWRMFVGFFFCFLGDYFLAKKESGDKEKQLILGLLSFLLGHCTFLIALWFIQPMNVYTAFLPLFGVVLVLFLMRFQYMEVGKLKVPVLIYTYFVTALFVKCFQVTIHGDGSLFYSFIFLGGLLFLISDLIILFLYFYQKQYKILKFLNLATYYGAMFLLSVSIYYS